MSNSGGLRRRLRNGADIEVSQQSGLPPGTTVELVPRDRPAQQIPLQSSLQAALQRRAAKARHNREVPELRRAVHEFQATIERALSQVEIASRAVTANYRAMLARYQAMISSEQETELLTRRWQLVPQGELTGARILEQLLESQSRRATSEAAFIETQIRYTVSLTSLKLTTGEAFSSHLTIN